MTEATEVVVVGGGAVGTSTARTLAEAGTDVVLLEAGSIGGASTGKSAGMFRRAFATEPMAGLAARSVAAFEELEETTGGGIGLHAPGYLILGGADHRASLERAADNAARFGADVERYDDVPADLPGHDDPAVDYAVLVRGDGYADPYLVATEQARRAADAGADVRTDGAVTDLAVEDGRITAVRTDGGELRTDAVVVAAGAWSSRIAALAGVDLPVDPVRTFAATTPTTLPADHPMVLSLPENVYYRDEVSEGTLIGGPLSTEREDPDDYDGRVDLDKLLDLGERVARVDPRYENFEVESSWAGLKATTPDKSPLVGIHPERGNMVCATGFNGHGFMLSPGVGDVAAALARGEEPPVDVSPLSPARFAADARRTADTTIDLQ